MNCKNMDFIGVEIATEDYSMYIYIYLMDVREMADTIFVLPFFFLHDRPLCMEISICVDLGCDLID